MYLDPGSGSVIFQIILAGLLGLGVFVKVFWRKFIALFKSSNSEEVFQDECNKE